MIKDILITEQINIPPKLLNDKLMSTIESICNKKLVNKCDDETGYIMEIINIHKIKGGNIVGDAANVIYNVTVKVKVFTVDKDEILNAIITKIDNKGLFAQAGPFQIYVSISKIPSDYKFENGKYIRQNSTDTLEVNKMIPIKVIGKKLSGINKMVVGSIE
jgi:DNA-directed RNA polymerase subunit E'